MARNGTVCHAGIRRIASRLTATNATHARSTHDERPQVKACPESSTASCRSRPTRLAPAEGSSSYIIAAADTVMNRPSASLLKEVFPGVRLTRDVGEFGTLLANDRAKDALGFTPQHSWRDHLPS